MQFEDITKTLEDQSKINFHFKMLAYLPKSVCERLQKYSDLYHDNICLYTGVEHFYSKNELYFKEAYRKCEHELTKQYGREIWSSQFARMNQIREEELISKFYDQEGISFDFPQGEVSRKSSKKDLPKKPSSEASVDQNSEEYAPTEKKDSLQIAEEEKHESKERSSIPFKQASRLDDKIN